MSKTPIRSRIHRKHAAKLARATADAQAQTADSLNDDAINQLIDDCFGDDCSVELYGSMDDTDSFDEADAQAEA